MAGARLMDSLFKKNLSPISITKNALYVYAHISCLFGNLELLLELEICQNEQDEGGRGQ
jgi:hypothetical protein